MSTEGETPSRSLEETPTWAVAVVCFVLVVISIIIEHIIHMIGKWLKKKHKRALYDALEKVKSELMLLGFISLLLTVGSGTITSICISERLGSTWHPCARNREDNSDEPAEDASEEHRRRLLMISDSGRVLRRSLAGSSEDKCADQGKVPFISYDALDQLHYFIFVLAIVHVLYCILTLGLGRAKMRAWKRWEKETRTIEYQYTHDPERFRFARETSFGRRHLSSWTKSPILLWIVCFFRQFVRSVPKVDYLTLRHGFITAHLAPQSQNNFNFQKYINRSLEEDFSVVVGISPPIWFCAVLFLLFNPHGWYSYLWLPFVPLIVILLVGTKLQVIITKMAQKIQERGEVVRGQPVVEPGDDLFWFNRPKLLLFLINFVLFQNAFQLAFFAYTWYEFGISSCFHEEVADLVISISMGVVVQILCSYVTLPLYALVTQMGSNMKPTIFNERVATALKKWHRTARKHVKSNKGSVTPTPFSSMPNTPSRHASPIHLLKHYQNEMDSVHTSPGRLSFEIERSETESPSISYHNHADGSSSHNPNLAEQSQENINGGIKERSLSEEREFMHHTINIMPKEFSFERRPSI
ncbi:MILDEW RESISTANCE LOCUS O 6 [Hibiscus trionum]|uniref:MLO-like protein n=1 Tax=Hibiscus trionum TaxID=183268 RepID=A0A9W7M0J1_HIBTR|nr:MILDEW RESISTANCE LOCUS O 6 [Hibiscus trionum]